MHISDKRIIPFPLNFSCPISHKMVQDVLEVNLGVGVGVWGWKSWILSFMSPSSLLNTSSPYFLSPIPHKPWKRLLHMLPPQRWPHLIAPTTQHTVFTAGHHFSEGENHIPITFTAWSQEVTVTPHMVTMDTRG